MQRPKYNRQDFDHSPMIIFYEMKRACDLRYSHCRADAQRQCHPDELTTSQSMALIDQLTEFPKPPLLVLTSATPLVTQEAINRLKQSGLHRLAVSLDGADAATHDGFRGVAGSFQRTMEVVIDARRSHLPVQINTTVARHNIAQLDSIADLLSGLDIELCSVFFLMPTGRASATQRLSADACEAVFEKLWRHMKRQPYAIKTTEAPHFRRFLLQQKTHRPGAGMIGTNDGRGVMFVSHVGEIYPSGFLPICCGKFPLDSLMRIYQRAELFVALRDADRLNGKCGECEYRNLCGGSRARAYGIMGDPLASEPDCSYEPADCLAKREACPV